jgi:hypothetical protein
LVRGVEASGTEELTMGQDRVVDEGRILGYRYAVVEIREGEYIWWAERPGGTACWKGNVFAVPTSPEEAKKQINEMLQKFGVHTEPD